MSIKDQFTEDEWFLLSSTPAMVGSAMSSAAASGVIGTVKEMTASMKSTVAALKDYPDSELIQALLEKAENWDAAKDKMSDYRERAKQKLEDGQIKSREQLHEQAIKDCRDAATLVDAKCNAADAKVFREWTLKVANNVAAAASEGGFLGFGGEKISPEETAMLARIEEALGVKGATLMA